MTEKVIFVVLGVGNQPAPFYLVDSDVNARQGLGSIVVSDDIKRAKRFPDIETASRYWNRQSIVMPVRQDGGPNAPLTAFKGSVVDAPRAEQLDTRP